ncbi:SDR family oxidoreductase [Candidatus Sumerlaeota bacterium]|nr:SDR family oxidoreductase [Candidatus Sumerlaeota bacterium]
MEQESSQPLRGQRVVVIGGSSGIGLTTAQRCAAAGASIVIASRQRSNLAKAAQAIGGDVETHALDFTRERKVERLFRRIGRFDHLVITAAQGAAGRFLELDTQRVRNLFEDKFWGQHHCAKHGAPHMSETGSITFFSSLVSRRAFDQLSAMGAANGAIESLTKTLALELAPRRVNVVLPGAIDSPAHDWMTPEARRAWCEKMAARTVMGRLGTCEDVAQVVLFLIRNPYVTGQVVVVDGGHSLL